LVDVILREEPCAEASAAAELDARHVVANVRARARRDGDRVLGVGVGRWWRQREGVVGCAARDGDGGHGGIGIFIFIVIINVNVVVARARDGRWARDGAHRCGADVFVGCVGERGGGEEDNNNGG
jgi:hypothetical protein